MTYDTDKNIADIACGSRMFWFDPHNPNVVFCDNRRETHELKDSSSRSGKRTLVIDPDMLADFTDLPFDDNSFALVVFDPPHLANNGKSGWLAKKYGKLGVNWKEDIQAGFREAFRILRPEGVLVFKWNETDIPLKSVLELTPHKPLIGNRCGKRSQSHWLVFMKPAAISI